MDDLVERLRNAAEAFPENLMAPLLSEAADAMEAAQSGLRYVVWEWVLSDEIGWSETEIDEAVERILGYAKEEASND